MSDLAPLGLVACWRCGGQEEKEEVIRVGGKKLVSQPPTPIMPQPLRD